MTKKRARLSVGPYPEVSLAAARKRRDESRALVRQGIDPKTHRDDQRMQSV